MKKEWTKPKLVVLFRARADENVLGFCKLELDGTGSTNEFFSCNRILIDPSVPDVCQEDVNCETQVAS